MKVLIIITAVLMVVLGYFAFKPSQSSQDELPLVGVQNQNQPQDDAILAKILQKQDENLLGGGDTKNQLANLINFQTSDAAQERWMRVYLLQLQSARRIGGQTCSNIAMPANSREPPSRIKSMLSLEAQNKTVEAIEFAIREIGKKQTFVSDRQAADYIQMLDAEVYKRAANLSQAAPLRDDLDEVVGQVQSAGHYQQAARLQTEMNRNIRQVASLQYLEKKPSDEQCQVVIAYVQAALSLPERERSAVIRAFLMMHDSVVVF